MTTLTYMERLYKGKLAIIEPTYLSGSPDTFPDTEVNDDPGEQETQTQIPLNVTWLVHTVRYIQHLTSTKYKEHVYYFKTALHIG